MKIAALALCSLLVVACSSEDDEEPTVNWSGIPTYQHRLINQAVEDGDCERMQTYFDGTSNSNADVLDYLDWHMRKAGCY